MHQSVQNPQHFSYLCESLDYRLYTRRGNVRPEEPWAWLSYLCISNRPVGMWHLVLASLVSSAYLTEHNIRNMVVEDLKVYRIRVAEDVKLSCLWIRLVKEWGRPLPSDQSQSFSAARCGRLDHFFKVKRSPVLWERWRNWKSAPQPVLHNILVKVQWYFDVRIRRAVGRLFSLSCPSWSPDVGLFLQMFRVRKGVFSSRMSHRRVDRDRWVSWQFYILSLN